MGIGPVMLPIRYLTIHCAATPEGRNDSAEKIEGMDIARFGQPSYHWIVLLDGTSHRSLRDDERGAHVAQNNSGNIGVCYVGGVDRLMKAKDTRTALQRSSLLKIVREYQDKYPGLVVRGHRDWPGVTKACPSFSVQSWLTSEGIGG